MPSNPARSAARTLTRCAIAIVACALAWPSFAGRLPVADPGEVAGVASAPDLKVAGGVVTVVEYHASGPDHYYMTADPEEIARLDGGAFGAIWQRTGNVFQAWDSAGAPAGTVPVCSHFGAERRHPRPRAGPSGAFHTAGASQCAALAAGRPPVNEGRPGPDWTFDPYAFAVKPPAAGGACASGTQPLYRSFNNNAQGASNYRHSTSLTLLQGMAGWEFQGVVMCVPQPASPTAPGQFAACGEADCPAATPIGSGVGLVNVIVDVTNNTGGPVELVVPAGQTFVSTDSEHQDGLAVERLHATVAPGASGRFVLRLFCLQQSRAASKIDAAYVSGPVTTSAPLLDIVGLADGKLGAAGDPLGLKANVVQFAVWEITDGRGTLTGQQRGLLAALLATAPDDLLAQTDLAQQFFATLTLPAD